MFALDHAIPIIDWERGSYREIEIDEDDPRHDEPLVRLESVGVAYETYHARTDGRNPPYHRPVEGSRPDMWLRRSAAALLAEVDDVLRSFGFALLVLDGYRPIACQRGLWSFYYERARRTLDDPTPEACRAEALGFVADPTDFSPDDPRSWPSHTTGGAVDVTLRSLATGQVVDMGSRFDEITPTSCNDHFERLLARGEVEPDDPRLWHRRLVHFAMDGRGFVNDPFVFWHYDWGNQLGIKVAREVHGRGPTKAWYGYIEPPEAD